MRFVIALLVPLAAAITTFWWWIGFPVAMPASPFGPGEKLACVSYAPFRGAETPLVGSTPVDPKRIDEDLAQLAKLTDCVRTYSTGLGLDQVPEIAGRYGLKVLQGAWLNDDPAMSRREIESAIALAEKYPRTIAALVVGNETLLRGEIAEADLAATIRNVRSRVQVPVTYGDVWEFWLRHRSIADAVDFVTVHILPYWEDEPVSAANAARHVDDIRRRVAEAFPGREILIGEFGWPSAGRMRDAALPSPVNQARVLHDVLSLAKRAGYRLNVIEAFDQPWKRALEGTVGGHWGLLDGDTRRMKLAWGEPVSNHPLWRVQAAGGVLLAGLILLAGHAVRSSRSASAGVAVVALVAGLFAPWSVANVPLESLGLGGWAMSLALAGLAVLAPLACAIAISRGAPAPVFARLLAPGRHAPLGYARAAVGVMLILCYVVSIVIALGLVFDARYRDLPFAPMTAASVSFAALSLSSGKPEGARGLAEAVGAVAIGGSAIFFAIREGVANWQAMWLAATLVVFALTLLRVKDVRD